MPADDGSHAQPPRDFELITPDSWIALDLGPRREAEIRRWVSEHVRDAGELAAMRQELLAQLERATRDAEAQGAVYYALYSDVLADIPVTASLVAHIIPTPTDDAGVPLRDVPSAVAALAQYVPHHTDAPNGPDRRPGEGREASHGALDPAGGPGISGIGGPGISGIGGPGITGVRGVELPSVGPAVRIRRRMVGRLASDGRLLPTAIVQYHIPVPCDDNWLVLTFSTPTVVLADALAELFDAVAESLEWRW